MTSAVAAGDGQRVRTSEANEAVRRPEDAPFRSGGTSAHAAAAPAARRSTASLTPADRFLMGAPGTPLWPLFRQADARVCHRASRREQCDVKHHRAEAIERLQAESDKPRDRIDAMRVDKLDGRIAGDSFDRKAAEWRGMVDEFRTLYR